MEPFLFNGSIWKVYVVKVQCSILIFFLKKIYMERLRDVCSICNFSSRSFHVSIESFLVGVSILNVLLSLKSFHMEPLLTNF